MLFANADSQQLAAAQERRTARVVGRGDVIDLEWFELHPERSIYVRPAIEGEFADATPARDWAVAVRKPSDVHFLRGFFCCPDGDPITGMSRETAALIAFAIDHHMDRIAASIEALQVTTTLTERV